MQHWLTVNLFKRRLTYSASFDHAKNRPKPKSCSHDAASHLHFPLLAAKQLLTNCFLIIHIYCNHIVYKPVAVFAATPLPPTRDKDNFAFWHIVDKVL